MTPWVNNHDRRYFHGWRWWLVMAGVFRYRWARERAGGVWEEWFIGPCMSFHWEPVTERSDPEKNTRPCPFWFPGRVTVEDYTEKEMKHVGEEEEERQGAGLPAEDRGNAGDVPTTIQRAADCSGAAERRS